MRRRWETGDHKDTSGFTSPGIFTPLATACTPCSQAWSTHIMAWEVSVGPRVSTHGSTASYGMLVHVHCLCEPRSWPEATHEQPSHSALFLEFLGTKHDIHYAVGSHTVFAPSLQTAFTHLVSTYAREIIRCGLDSQVLLNEGPGGFLETEMGLVVIR